MKNLIFSLITVFACTSVQAASLYTCFGVVKMSMPSNMASQIINGKDTAPYYTLSNEKFEKWAKQSGKILIRQNGMPDSTALVESTSFESPAAALATLRNIDNDVHTEGVAHPFVVFTVESKGCTSARLSNP